MVQYGKGTNYMDELILMSIKTKYARQIFERTKNFEFRRKSIGEKNLNKKVFVYSSEEEKAIIGYIIFDKILEGTLDYILNATGHINNADIISYFKGCERCFALHISSAKIFKEPLYLNKIKEQAKNFTVPQFYRYIKADEYIYNELKEAKSR